MINQKGHILCLFLMLLSVCGSVTSSEVATADKKESKEHAAERRMYATFGLPKTHKNRMLKLNPTILSLIADKQYELAITKADELIKKQPDDVNDTPSAHVCKIFSYMQLRRYDEALACCEALRGKYGNDKRYHLGSPSVMRQWIDFVVPTAVACIRFEKGERDKALEELEKNFGRFAGGPKIVSPNAKIMDSLASSLRGRGLYTLAIAEYDRIIEKYPEDVNVIPGCYHGKVWAYIHMKEYDKATQTCDALANRYRNSTILSGSGVPMSFRVAGAYDLKAKVYEAQEEWALAIREYQSVIEFYKRPGILNKLPVQSRNRMEKSLNIDLPKLIEEYRKKILDKQKPKD